MNLYDDSLRESDRIAYKFLPENFAQNDLNNPFTSVFNSKQYDLAFNKQELAYNTFMANTQYQRAVEDMKRAGINPYVMYSSSAGVNSAPTISSHNSGQSALSSLINSAFSLASKVLTMKFKK